MALNKHPSSNPGLIKTIPTSSSTPSLPASLKTMESARAAYMPTSQNTRDAGIGSFKKSQNALPGDKLFGVGHKKKPTFENLDELAKIPSGAKLPVSTTQAKSRSPSKILELSGKNSPTSQALKAPIAASKFHLKVVTTSPTKQTNGRADFTNPELENTISTLNTYGLFPDQETSSPSSLPGTQLKRKGSETTAENKLHNILNPAVELKKKPSLRDDLYQLKLDVEKSKQMLEKKSEVSLKLGTSNGSIKKAIRGTAITKAAERTTEEKSNASNSARKVSGDRSRSRPRSFMNLSTTITDFHLLKQIGKGKFGDVHMSMYSIC